MAIYHKNNDVIWVEMRVRRSCYTVQSVHFFQKKAHGRKILLAKWGRIVYKYTTNLTFLP